MSASPLAERGPTYLDRRTAAGQPRLTPEDHQSLGDTAYRLAREHERAHGIDHEDTVGLYREAATHLVNVVVQGRRDGKPEPVTMFKIADSLAKQAEVARDPYLERIATRDAREAALLAIQKGRADKELASELEALDPDGVPGIGGVPEILDPEQVSDMAERAIEQLTDEHELPLAA